MFNQYGANKVRLNVAFPDANDRVSTCRKVFVPGGIAALLVDLAFGQCCKPRVSVPVFAVGFNDKPFTNHYINNKVRLYQNLVFVGNADVFQDAPKSAFETAWLVSLHLYLRFMG